MTEAARLAKEIYTEVLREVRGNRLIAALVDWDGRLLTFRPGLAAPPPWHSGPISVDLEGKRLRLAGAGKASVSMAQGLELVLGSRISDGLIVTKAGDPGNLARCRILESSHPLLDERSLLAGAAMRGFAESCGPEDVVVLCLSGGASALLEDLPAGWTLAQLRDLNERLLASGVDIHEMNRQRRAVSRLKAGRLAALFAPALVITLVMSDVEGNPPETIGSGPLYCPEVPHLLVADRTTVERAASAAAQARGLRPVVGPKPLSGECRERAASFVSEGLSRLAPGEVGIGTGETVVDLRTVEASFLGQGGRAQEFAMAGAKAIDGQSGVALLCGSTDGTDGPTEASGGVVDGGSVSRALANGVAWEDGMARHDSRRFLEACGGLITTGPSGSNLNDLALLVRT